jgi:hypothetical protein
MRRLAKVNDLENCGAIFTYLSLGALRGLSPAEGGSGKAAGFVAWGKAFPLLFDIDKLLYDNLILYYK